MTESKTKIIPRNSIEDNNSGQNKYYEFNNLFKFCSGESQQFGMCFPACFHTKCCVRSGHPSSRVAQWSLGTLAKFIGIYGLWVAYVSHSLEFLKRWYICIDRLLFDLAISGRDGNCRRIYRETHTQKGDICISDCILFLFFFFVLWGQF